jgi:hypothetical protein
MSNGASQPITPLESLLHDINAGKFATSRHILDDPSDAIPSGEYEVALHSLY